MRYGAEVTTSNAIVRIDDLVADPNPITIIQMVVQGGQTDAASMIKIALCEYLENINLRSSMSEKQVDIAVSLMIEKHPHLPIASFPLFFKDALCGKFGEHYGRMDIPTLMRWLQKFENDYFDMVEEQSYSTHQSTKGDKANYTAIIMNQTALAQSSEDDEIVPMPESLEKKLGLKHEHTIADEIRERVIKENSHLFSTMDFDKAQEYIVELINNELMGHGIFNLD